MTDTEKDIKEMYNVIRVAVKTTPIFLNGLLIPASKVDEFYSIVKNLTNRARDADKYWNQIVQATEDSEIARNDFVKALCDGKIKIQRKE